MKKKFAFFSITCMIFMSCASFNHGIGHPAVSSVGNKSFRESQHNIASNFGGKNYNKPNKFKDKHFK